MDIWRVRDRLSVDSVQRRFLASEDKAHAQGF
jgi:hypothetical protein